MNTKDDIDLEPAGKCTEAQARKIRERRSQGYEIEISDDDDDEMEGPK